MKSFCILGVILFRSIVELQAATSVSQFSCQKRNLTLTVDDELWLFIDGVEITGLPNSADHDVPDVVDFPCTTKLIAIHGRNGPSTGGILASTDDDYVLTNSSWKCSNISYSGWEEIGFDDSAWRSAEEFVYPLQIPSISSEAEWIWLRKGTSGYEVHVYCRKSLDPNYCAIFSPCLFGATCIDEPNDQYQCICAPGYSGENCSFVIDYCDSSPCATGSCLSILNGFICECPPGFTGNQCQYLIDACDPNPCRNSGTCTNIDGVSFTCNCPIYATGVICESPNYNEAFACGTTLTWSQYDAVNGFTRLCYFWTHVDDTEARFTTCRNTINGIPLYGNYTGLLNAGGNFGCVVSQNYPDDIPATSYLSCSDNFQQDVYLGNVSETDRLMVCIRYPYDGLPGRKQH